MGKNVTKIKEKNWPKEFREFTPDQWLKEGERRFGKDVEKWRVKCSMCGTITELSEYKDAGAESPDCAFKECIGRYVTGKGCNWCTYGLFGLPSDDRYVIRFPDGHKDEIFPFAPEEEKI